MPRKDSGEPVWGQGELDLGRVPVGRAKICPLPESEPGLTGNVAASGVNTSEPFAHFDHATSSWKTYQVCLLTNTWDVFSETWPRAGTMRNGIVYQQVPLAPITGGIESGLLPTPRAIYGEHPGMKDPRHLTGAIHLWPTPNVPNGGRTIHHATVTGKTAMHNGKKVQIGLEAAVKMWPTPKSCDWKGGGSSQKAIDREEARCNLWGAAAQGTNGGALNPNWVEWLMGYPIGWTDLGD